VNRLWGKSSSYITSHKKADSPAARPSDARVGHHIPSAELKKALIARDGYHCRFCGIPLIRSEGAKSGA